MKKYNIGLTFSPDIVNQIINYANNIYKVMDSDVLLGINSKPHITIGQFSVEDGNAREVWQKYKNTMIDMPKVNLAGITILPSSSGGAWIEISVLKSDALNNIQQALIDILEPFGTLTNDIGDKYRPHITIAHTEHGEEFARFPYKNDVLRLKSVPTQLEIGLGTAFEYLKI